MAVISVKVFNLSSCVLSLSYSYQNYSASLFVVKGEKKKILACKTSFFSCQVQAAPKIVFTMFLLY